jgi:hypothetical protein
VLQDLFEDGCDIVRVTRLLKAIRGPGIECQLPFPGPAHTGINHDGNAIEFRVGPNPTHHIKLISTCHP